MDIRYLLALGLIVCLNLASAQELDTKIDISTENGVLAREVKELKRSVKELKRRKTKSKDSVGLIYPSTESQSPPNGNSNGFLLQYLPDPLNGDPDFWPYTSKIETCLSSCCQARVYKNFAQSLESNENVEALNELIEKTASHFIDRAGLSECQSQAVSWMIYFDSVSNNYE